MSVVLPEAFFGGVSIVLWNLIEYFYSGTNGIGRGHYCHFSITGKSVTYFLCLSSWLRQLVLYPSQGRPMFSPWPLVDRVALGWVFHWVLWFSTLNTIPPVLHTCVSFIYYWCCIILAIDSIVQWNTSVPQIFSVVDFNTERREFYSVWH